MITLDGPAGAGKSTVARNLAKRLSISYLDTGAMYRALTLKALRLKIKLDDEKALTGLARKTVIDFKEMPDGSLHVTLDGEDVAEAIRSIEVTNHTFHAARTAAVRAMMVNAQRAIARHRSFVTDGRDQGTVVFPKADYKFYIDADLRERVHRRHRELKEAGEAVDAAQLKKDMQERDHKDFSRVVGPLKKAEDAIVIDSTGLNVQQTVDKVMTYIKT
ncbi:MAG: (d)CMP kinase [Candidatus Omnitrophica bacterium]|nr:(d)CMP kinase [Candidatus Omnitrophota bacterium]